MSPATDLTPTIESGIIDKIMDTLGVSEYGPWCIYWTGWKPIPFQDLLIGQWIAKLGASKYVPLDKDNGFPGQPKMAYSCAPGDCGWFSVGHVFGCDIRVGQTPIDSIAPYKVKEHERRVALEKLILFLLEEGLHPKPEPADGFGAVYTSAP